MAVLDATGLAHLWQEIKAKLNAKANANHTHALDGTSVTGTLPLTKGGTGATTAAAARSKLGLGALATKGSVSLSGSDATGTLPISKGGTGAETAQGALAALGAFPQAGGTTVDVGPTRGRIAVPGIASGWGTARDYAALKVTNGGEYTPAMSIKCEDCTWDIAGYAGSLDITKFLDTAYASGGSSPQKEFRLKEDGIVGLQSIKYLAGGSLSAGANISGMGDMLLHRAIYVLFGEWLNNDTQWFSFTCPFAAGEWGVYLPAANDYYRAKIVIENSGLVTVSMLSSGITKTCYIYADL